MDELSVVDTANGLLWTGLLLVAPAVIVSLFVGLLMSIFQTVTSIQEQTLSFAPRILAVGAVISVTLAWNIQVVSAFTINVIQLPLRMFE
jgi:flagellar biosynthetic protein FliQ